jgi:hypothetical protein
MISLKSRLPRHVGLAFAACAALIPALAACSSGGPPSWAAKLGSGVTVTAPQSYSAGNDSPGAAIYGYITGLTGKTPSAACAYAQPTSQASCKSGLSTLTPSQVPVSVKNFGIGWVAVNGTKALVGTTGTFCDKGQTPPCFTNTDPAAVLDSGKSFGDVWTESQNTSGNKYSLAPTIQVGGKWYIDTSNS